MSQLVPRDVLLKVRKLALLPQEARQCQFAVPVTRLTSLKSLCHQPGVANHFVTYLAGKTLERVQKGKGRCRIARDLAHRQLIADTLVEMQALLKKQTEERRQRLRELLERMRSEQNEYQRIKWGSARLITDAELLVFEYALHYLLGMAHEAGHWAYQTAHCYAERYDSNHGTGLIPSSAPLVQDIADFWLQEFGLDSAALTAPAEAKKPRKEKPTTRARKGSTSERQKVQFTARQGQFLAFIHLYRRLDGEWTSRISTSTMTSSLLVLIQRVTATARSSPAFWESSTMSRFPMRARIAFLILALGLLTVSGPLAQTQKAQVIPQDVILKTGIEYTNPDDQHLQLNLAMPKTGDGPFPAIVCIHGGGFRAGKRESYDAQCVRLAQCGYVALTVSYRLAPKYPFPAAIHGVKAAIR